MVEWCERHKDDPIMGDDTDEWDKEHLQVDQEMLLELILASKYLVIKPLLDVCCKTVANMVGGKISEGTMKALNIPNDFTPEEKEQIENSLSGLE